MHQDLHHFWLEVPRLPVFFNRVDLGLDQPLIDAEIPLHQFYLTKCTNTETAWRRQDLLAFGPSNSYPTFDGLLLIANDYTVLINIKDKS
jgi:hypothetical protein